MKKVIIEEGIFPRSKRLVQILDNQTRVSVNNSKKFSELCGNLLNSKSIDQAKFANSILKILEFMKITAGEGGQAFPAELEEAFSELEVTTSEISKSIAPGRILIDKIRKIKDQLDSFVENNSMNSTTFEETIQQIKDACEKIKTAYEEIEDNGKPEPKNPKRWLVQYKLAKELLDLIFEFHQNPTPRGAFLIGYLFKEFQAVPLMDKIRASTGSKGRWKPIFDKLNREGCDLSDSAKAHREICAYLQREGIPKEDWPSMVKIQKRFSSWKPKRSTS